jgi:hypothetical protein
MSEITSEDMKAKLTSPALIASLKTSSISGMSGKLPAPNVCMTTPLTSGFDSSDFNCEAVIPGQIWRIMTSADISVHVVYDQEPRSRT